MQIFKISGGLGNQMFQYAFAKAVQYTTNDDCYIDLSHYGSAIAKKGINTQHNGFELGRLFNMDLPIADWQDVKRLSSPATNYFNRFKRRYFPKPTHIIEKNFRYQSFIFNKGQNAYYEGYWQTEKYFSVYCNEILSAFQFVPKVSARTEKVVNMDCIKTSIHVRRGDYLNYKGFDVCGKDYYEKAMQVILKTYPEGKFICFSDDIKWCKDNLLYDDIIYVDWNTGFNSWEDMYIMSKCNNNIIANSSFSWWGAWLNGSINKIILAPETWCDTTKITNKHYIYDFTDILPDSWIKIGNE
jgi:Glycosyl transferase family 11.